MQRGILVVQTEANANRDSAFNDWYHSTHIPEILECDGMEAARRFEQLPIPATTDREDNEWLPYLAVYEVVAPDLARATQAVFDRFSDGTMSTSADGARTRVQLFRLIHTADERDK